MEAHFRYQENCKPLGGVVQPLLIGDLKCTMLQCCEACLLPVWEVNIIMTLQLLLLKKTSKPEDSRIILQLERNMLEGNILTPERRSRNQGNTVLPVLLLSTFTAMALNCGKGGVGGTPTYSSHYQCR